MKKKYTDARTSLFIALLSFSTLSACVHARQQLSMNVVSPRKTHKPCWINSGALGQALRCILFPFGLCSKFYCPKKSFVYQSSQDSGYNSVAPTEELNKLREIEKQKLNFNNPMIDDIKATSDTRTYKGRYV